MARDLGSELKQYTVNVLESISKEVNFQFDKWAEPRVGFLDQLCKAQKDAVEEQFKVLKEREEEERRCFERSLFVLELLTIGATAWLGATLELRVGGKIFYEYEKSSNIWLPTKWLKKIPDEFQSKVFGDASKDLVSTLFKVTGEQFAAPPPPKEMDAHRVVYSPNADVFGANLFEEVKRQRDAVSTNINKITQDVFKSPTFGEALAKRLHRQNPHISRLTFNDQLLAGQKMINDLIQQNRETWAKDWIYYGNDPPKPSWQRIKKELERQIWVVWIIQQHFHLEEVVGLNRNIVVGASGAVLNTTGGFASEIKDSPIVRRLFEEFNAPVTDIILKGSPTSQDQVDRLNTWARNQDQTRLNKELAGTRRELKPVDQIW